MVSVEIESPPLGVDQTTPPRVLPAQMEAFERQSEQEKGAQVSLEAYSSPEQSRAVQSTQGMQFYPLKIDTIQGYRFMEWEEWMLRTGVDEV